MENPYLPPRRRRPWVLPAVTGGLLLAGVLVAAAALTGPTSPAWQDSDPATGITVEDSDGLAALLDPVAVAADEQGTAADRPGRPWRRGHPPLRLRDGEKVVAGAVGSAADGKLVVRKDNGVEVTVPTDGDTKVRGAKNRQLSDLGAGERVVVRVGSDGTADGVLAVRAHAAGTVTALDGDRATVVRVGGLATTLDLSGVEERPAVGTAVIAVGSATDDGNTLKVEELRELPTLG